MRPSQPSLPRDLRAVHTKCGRARVHRDTRASVLIELIGSNDDVQTAQVRNTPQAHIELIQNNDGVHTDAPLRVNGPLVDVKLQ